MNNDLSHTTDLQDRLKWLQAKIDSERLILKGLIQESEFIKETLAKREKTRLLVEKFNPYSQNLNVTTMRRK